MDVDGALKEAFQKGQDIALATIVAVEGSAYRHEGARMVVFTNGNFFGTLSGGCLEEDAASLGRRVLEDARPRLLHYDLDDDTVFGLGLGCPGKVNILVERVPLATDPRSPLSRFVGAVAEGRPAALVRSLAVGEGGEVDQLTHLFVGEGLSGSVPEGVDLEEAARRARALLERRSPRSEWAEVSGLRLFVDVFTPSMEIVVFGAGDDAVPLAALARRVGYGVTVVDVRRHLLTKERFPGCRLVHARDREAMSREIQMGPRTMALAMNHQIDRDKEALAFALNAPVAYVGLLGPRERGERTLGALKAMGALPEGRMARLHNPVGLDIGAQTPEEIALAILAEMVARREGREAGFLRDRTAPVHDPRPQAPLRRVSHGS